MIRVDEKFLELATRVFNYKGDAGAFDFFILGGSFHAAWLTGSQMRTGGQNVSHVDMQEYNRVKDALQRLDWLDLLDP